MMLLFEYLYLNPSYIFKTSLYLCNSQGGIWRTMDIVERSGLEAACISNNTNVLGKGMDPDIDSKTVLFGLLIGT